VPIVAKGKKTAIRPITLEDAEIFARWWNDGRVMKDVGFPEGLGISLEKVREDFQKEIREGKKGFPDSRRFVILDRLTDQPVGEISFGKIDYSKRSCRIGMKIGKVTEQGKGLGADALQTFMDYLYDRYGFWSIDIDVLSDNQRALGLYQKVGFVIEEEVQNYWTDPSGNHRDVVFLKHQREPRKLVDYLNKRCSVRDFGKEAVGETVIDEVLEAGRLSPSGGNEQPWKFALIQNRELMERIVESAYNQVWMLDASFWVVLITKIVSDDRGGRDIQKSRFPQYEDQIDEMDQAFYARLNQEEHQTKIPGTHMVLAALEHGVGSTWVSYFKVDEVQELLGLSSNEIPSEILAFGYPQKPMKSTGKKPMESILLRYD